MQLTKTLLKLDFGLRIDLPDNRLCPPVPNRHNYVLWLKDLMDTTSYDPPGGRRSGLDIGTGASCIYPLLSCAQRPWHFVGTDIDETNLSYARKNVELNGLQSRIRILPRRATDKLVPLDDLEVESIDFVMTNPPFYESEKELLSSAKQKSRPPLSACTGAPVEMVCEGGEVAFVSRLISESLILRERVQWYSSMLGKLSSLEIIIDELHENGIDNYSVTELVQGAKTRRWAVAWSFGPMRPSQATARGMAALAWKKILPPPVEVAISTRPTKDTGAFANKVNELMQSLELISWEWDVQKLSGIGRARENVWSRAWRRKKMREASEGHVLTTAADDETCVLGFAITVSLGMAEMTATCRWTEGHDESIFESFCGFVRAQLKNA